MDEKVSDPEPFEIVEEEDLGEQGVGFGVGRVDSDPREDESGINEEDLDEEELFEDGNR